MKRACACRSHRRAETVFLAHSCCALCLGGFSLIVIVTRCWLLLGSQHSPAVGQVKVESVASHCALCRAGRAGRSQKYGHQRWSVTRLKVWEKALGMKWQSGERFQTFRL